MSSARRFRNVSNSRIARLIFASNLAGILILIVGSLVLNEMRAGLVQARVDSLTTQGNLIVSVLAEGATIGEPSPSLQVQLARRILKRLELPATVSARIYDRRGNLVGDYALLSDQVKESELPDIGEASVFEEFSRSVSNTFDSLALSLQTSANKSFLQPKTLEEELKIALLGEAVAGERITSEGQRIVSVSIPIQRVSAVVGVLTLEASDVAEIVRKERAALFPFIGVAVIVSLMSAALLTYMIARPLRKLALAADEVRSGQAEKLELPMLTKRHDEIGDLAGSLEAMTDTLFNRIVANEAFAADVAHELKNPLTSIRSAVETADRVTDPEARDKLRKVIASDVRRLDRLITDISNATRLEAEIVRAPNEKVDLKKLLSELAYTYDAIRNEGDPRVLFELEDGDIQLTVMGRESPLGQVFRNLIENARSFSPENGNVRVSGRRFVRDDKTFVEITIEDEGPGIPDDKLEKIFDRFYTDRPSGAKFGLNSGLGLSIVKQIIESHRGTVKASNRTDASGNITGARFSIELIAVAQDQ